MMKNIACFVSLLACLAGCSAGGSGKAEEKKDSEHGRKTKPEKENPRASVRAGDEAPAAPDVKKLADQVGQKDWDALSKEGQTISKKYTALIDVMGVFQLRKNLIGVSGLGVGQTPGAIVPDGIQAKILNLSERVSKEDLDKAADLKRMAEIAAAVAGIAVHMPKDDAKKTKETTKKWQEYSKDMHDASKDLIKSLDGKNPAQVKEAALKLQNACTACHNDFRQ